jgi:hypothetical protein
MTTRRSLAAFAAAVLLAIGGVGLVYWMRSQESAPGVSVAPSPTPAASVAITPTTAPTPSLSATAPTPSPSATTQTDGALQGADRFAVVVEKGCSPPGPPPYVRREDRSEVISALGNGYLCELRGAVSPDGRRLAYWHFESTGSSEIALYQGGASTTLVRLGEELLGNVVWSSDGTGLLFVAMKGGVQGVAPDYAALRTLDLATGTIQELSRVAGRYVSALAWDRARRVTAAAETPASGGVGAYLVITEARVITRNEMPANVVLMSASPDAAFVLALAQKDFAIRYWPLTSFDDQRMLLAAPGFGAGIAAWRPGTREIAVVVSGGTTQSLELWSIDGSRRRLTDFTSQSGGLFFRPDGSALFFGGAAGVDIATGRVVQFQLAQGERLAASLLR